MISEAEVADKFFALVYSQPKDTFFYTAFTDLEDAREYAKTLPRAEEFIKIYDEKGKEYELGSLKEFDFYDDNENGL